MRPALVGDFHYNGHVLRERHGDCARALAKLRAGIRRGGDRGSDGETRPSGTERQPVLGSGPFRCRVQVDADRDPGV